MNAADESLGNVLLVGLGAVAIQVALDLRRHGAGRLGALNHPGRRSQRIDGTTYPTEPTSRSRSSKLRAMPS